MFDRDAVTLSDIRALYRESSAGDYVQSRLCERALDGDDEARELCADAIADAAVPQRRFR